MDEIYRDTLLSVGLQNLPNKPRMKKIMLDRQSVDEVWKKIVGLAGVSTTSAATVLDFVVSLFVTVKGCAVAKRQMFLLKVKKEKISLRGKLKKEM